MNPAELTTNARDLTAKFSELGFTVSGISEYLGPSATAAWRRGEPAAVRLATKANEPLGLLIRAFILGDPTPVSELEALLGTWARSLLQIDGESGTVQFDVTPHVFGETDRWVFSDRDASMQSIVPGPDHVLGVGAASLSLMHSVPTSSVDTLLDLGTGSGVQILGQVGVAKHLIGTDVHPRALDFARTTLAGAGIEGVELLQGSWFEPVAGRQFDRIVANPPFVVGMPEVGHVYRDSGLNLDSASELVVGESVSHLSPNGSAHILAAWVHKKDESWQQRIASWLPDQGVAAWILQRDVADPELYVSTWLRDESIDPRSPEGQARTDAWLQHFQKHEVTGVGFGFVALKRIEDDQPSDIVVEELSQEFEDHLGSEVEEYFLRATWLREATFESLAESTYAVRPTVAVEDVQLPDPNAGMGFETQVLRISRMDGPRFSHEIDQHVVSMLSGLHPSGLGLAEVAELYCAAKGLDVNAVLPGLIGIVVDLIRHGFLIPADLLSSESFAEDVEEEQ